jgi:hypothetical protein
LISSAGPLSLLLVMATWAVGSIVGWALIIWPRLPDEFLYATGLDPATNSGFLDAVYISTLTLSTLGYGDITPLSTGLRLVEPLQALVGFALFTAAISWVLSVYPVLARRRNLAREVSLLQKTGGWSALASAEGGTDALNALLMGLGEQVIAVRNDLLQFPVTYYFSQTDEEAALDVVLPRLALFAEEASRHSSPSVRFQATFLAEAIRNLTTYLADSFLTVDDDSPATVFAAYANDHLRKPEADPAIAGQYLDNILERA